MHESISFKGVRFDLDLITLIGSDGGEYVQIREVEREIIEFPECSYSPPSL